MVKVLHIIKTLDLGGAERNLLNLAGSMDPSRIEIHVAYSGAGALAPLFRRSGLRLFQFSSQGHRVKSLASIGIIFRLCVYVLRHNIDAIHTHNFNPHVWGLIAGKLTGKKVIEHVHDFRYFDDEEFLRRRGVWDQKKFSSWFRNVSDRVIVLTEQNRRYLIDKKWYPPEKVIEMRNGIPMTERPLSRSDVRLKHAIGGDRLVILTAARMAGEKNVDLILGVASQVVETHPKALFLIAGDGPLLEELKKRSQSLGLEGHVRFIGFYDDIEELLAASDIFLLPSFLELHSIALLEAMRAGVPVVISRGVGCHDEFIVHGENGFLNDPFKKEGWAETLSLLLSDEALRRRVGHQGREYCRLNFDIKDVAKRFENLYYELAKRLDGNQIRGL